MIFQMHLPCILAQVEDGDGNGSLTAHQLHFQVISHCVFQALLVLPSKFPFFFLFFSPCDYSCQRKIILLFTFFQAGFHWQWRWVKEGVAQGHGTRWTDWHNRSSSLGMQPLAAVNAQCFGRRHKNLTVVLGVHFLFVATQTSGSKLEICSDISFSWA